jgi:peptidoglycan/xylan/chitin deacetylase (PgdA/CDA1 family)
MTAAIALRERAKRLARGMLARGPAYALARARVLADGALTILMYHTIGRDDEGFDAWTVVRRADFLRQIEWLRRHYEVVPLDDALQAAPAGTRPRAVITFDDGEAGLHEHLLPLLEREALPVTVYIATGQIASGRPYWFDRAMNAAQLASPVPLRLDGLPAVTLGAAQGEQGWRDISVVLEALKRLDPQSREQATDALEQALAAAPRRRFTALAPMTLGQLQALSASPWVTIGAHTHCHSLLDQLPLDAALQTIEHSRRLLREWTGRPIDHFAFPNGNHNAALVRAVEGLGLRSAMATGKGLWRPGEGRFAIQRVPVGRWDDLDKFRLDLLGGLAAAWSPRAPTVSPQPV